MNLPEFAIHQENKAGKGRVFRALRVSAVMADALWDSGSVDKHDRPVAATFISSEAELRPFAANLLCGRPAVPAGNNDGYNYRRRGSDSGYEFMRSAGYKQIWQRCAAGATVTLYLPDLFAVDPGMVDPKGIKFLVLPGRDYLADQAAKMGPAIASAAAYAAALPVVRKANEPERDWRGHVYSHWEEPLPDARLAEMVPVSHLFALYLTNRSRAPIPPDPRFYLQLLLACLKAGLASLSAEQHDDRRFGVNATYKFAEEGGEAGRLAPGVAFMADHEEIEAVLAAECKDFFMRTKGK